MFRELQIVSKILFYMTSTTFLQMTSQILYVILSDSKNKLI
jgi:hypothetical protein